MSRYVKRTVQTIVGLAVIGAAGLLTFGPGLLRKAGMQFWPMNPILYRIRRQRCNRWGYLHWLLI